MSSSDSAGFSLYDPFEPIKKAPYASSLQQEPFSSAGQAASSAIAFVSTAIDGYETLVAGMAPGTEVHLLTAADNALNAISTVLDGRQNVGSLHLFTHGSENSLNLGSLNLNADNLDLFAAELQQWQTALAPGADVLLYGCNVAAGYDASFLTRLAALTGADIAASSDLTGNVAQGGNWFLEVATGQIEAPSVLQTWAQEAFSGTLATIVVTSALDNTTVDGQVTLREALLSINAGAATNADVLATGPFGSGDQITFNITGAAIINLTSTLPFISRPVVIDGYTQPGATANTLATGPLDAVVPVVLDGTGAGSGTNGLVLTSGSAASRIQGLTIRNFGGSGLVLQSPTNTLVGNVITGNAGTGVFITSAQNTIGGAAASDRNLISNNIGAGVIVNGQSAVSNAILGNNIFGNTGLGIDLGSNGVTPNDPNDPDIGPNNLQNFPVINQVSGTDIRGTLNSLPNTTFTVQFFANTSATARQGEELLGTTSVTTDGTGNAAFVFAYTPVGGRPFITATATQQTANNTSEFSRINRAPSFTGNGAIAPTAEDTASNLGTAVSTTFSSLFSDPDGDSLGGIVVVGNAANPTTEGVWQYSTDNGSTWQNVNTVADDNTALVLSALTRLRFNPAANFNGTPPSLTVRAIDNTYSGTYTSGTTRVTLDSSINGGQNAIAGSTVTLSTSVTAVNDAPILNPAATVTLGTIDEDAAAPVGTVGTLITQLVDLAGDGIGLDNVTDVDAGAVTGIAIVGADTANGTWLYSINDGASWAPLGAVSTSSARLLAADGTTRIYFQPNANVSGTLNSALTFRAWDRSSGTNGGTANPGSGGGSSAFSSVTDTASLTINAANDAPVVTLAATPLSYTENAPATVLDASAIVTDVDSPNFDTGTLTVQFGQNGTLDDRLGIRNQGVATNQIGVSGSTVTFGGVEIGSFVGGEGTAPLVVSLNAQATPAAVQALLRNITYANVSENPSTTARRVEVTLADGDGGTSSVGTKTVNVSATNDPPIAQNDSYTFQEDVGRSLTAALGVLSNDTDPDGTPLTASIATAPLRGNLTLNGDGSFVYTPGANFNGVDSFTYRASDGVLSRLATVTLTIEAQNDAPIAVNNTYNLSEDTALTVNATAGILSNDTDVDGNSLTAVLANGVGNGTLNLSANGSFTYQPNLNFNGVDSFTYFANDGNEGTSNLATVSLSVSAVNDPPIAVSDAYDTDEDVPLTVAVGQGLLSNDSDVDSTSLTALVVTGPSRGSLSLNGNGSFVYTPNANANGSDSFTYRVSDGAATSAIATVSLSVRSIPDSPVAQSDSFSMAEDGTLNGSSVLANDTDVDSATITAAIVAGPANAASFTLNPNGTFTYIPQANFNGTDDFTYVVRDELGQASNQASVVITVTAVNDTPVAVADTYTVTEDVPLTVSAGNGLLTNDTDVEASPLTALIVTNPTNGSLSLNGNGSFVYTPNANFNGLDTFTYRASDGALSSPPTTVTLSVTSVNDAPVAVADGFVVAEDATLNGTSVLTNDTDIENNTPLTAQLVAGPAQALSFNLNPDGTFIYLPTANFNGSDSFTYAARDSLGAISNTTTVNLTVTPVNDAPVAVADSYSTAEDQSLSVAARGVLSNDTDIDSANLSAVLVTGPTNGSLTLNPNGSFVYNPNANFNGSDTFVYRASDGSLSNTATVVLTITPVNDAPSAIADAFSLQEDNSLVVSAPGILTNDTDIDGNPLSAILVAAPVNGVLSLNGTGGFVYTPNANFNGSDRFTYQASDGSLNSTVTTVSLSIAPVNDPPVAVGDQFSTNEDTALSVSAGNGVLSNDTDIDSTSLSAQLVSGVTNGTLTLNGNGSFVYTPNANFNGSDSFTYQVSDGAGTSNLATVSLSVAAVNDTPVATGDSFSLQEDGTLNASSVLTNDTDVEDGTSLSATLVSGPANAADFTLNPNGTFTYIPQANFNGSDRFTYTARDSQGAVSNIATVSLSIAPVNDPPVANPNTFSINEDATLNGSSVLANDTDIDSLTLTAELVAGPSNGATFSFSSNGTFTYVPTANFNGADSFTYRARDSQGAASNVTTVSISINPVNDAPVAQPDNYTTNEDTPLTVTAVGGVLSNDTDVDSTSLTAVLASPPPNGTVSFSGNGGFVYTPRANFFGVDQFIYRANDGLLSSTPTTVNVTVTSVNDPPLAVNDVFSLAEDGTLGNVSVLTNDTDLENNTPLTASLVEGPTNAQTFTLNPNGTLTYVPNANFNGTDQFTYVAVDNLGGTSGTATVNISITPVNDPPIANPDTYVTNEDTPLTIAVSEGVLSNDSDPENDPLAAGLLSNPTNGTLTFNGDGSFVYRPSANFSGTDRFTYGASDGRLARVATVSLTINPVNDAPTAVNDNYRTDINQALTVNATNGVLANDTDIDSATLSVSLISSPQNGTLFFNPSGSFVYIPDTNYAGVDTFIYQVADGQPNGTATATATVVVKPINSDFNNDGFVDLVFRNVETAGLGVWLMNGTSIAAVEALPSPPGPSWVIAGIGDFDQDGQSDVLWRDTATGANGLWLLNGTQINSVVALPSFSTAWTIFGVGDLSGDGQLDILWHNTQDGSNAIWAMNGTQYSTAIALQPSTSDWIVTGLADFNGDGNVDLLWRNLNSGDNVMWLMNRTEFASGAFLPAFSTSWAVAGVGDINNDGQVDIVWRNYAPGQGQGQNAVWFLNGTDYSSFAALPELSDLNWRMSL